MLSLKKFGISYYNIFLMLIAVSALVLSILSFTRKGEPFGNTGKCVQNPMEPEGSCEQQGGLGQSCTLPEQDGSADCNYAIGRECKCIETSNEYNCNEKGACSNDSGIPHRISNAEFKKEMQQMNKQETSNIMGNN